MQPLHLGTGPFRARGGNAEDSPLADAGHGSDTARTGWPTEHGVRGTAYRRLRRLRAAIVLPGKGEAAAPAATDAIARLSAPNIFGAPRSPAAANKTLVAPIWKARALSMSSMSRRPADVLNRRASHTRKHDAATAETTTAYSNTRNSLMFRLLRVVGRRMRGEGRPNETESCRVTPRRIQ